MFLRKTALIAGLALVAGTAFAAPTENDFPADQIYQPSTISRADKRADDAAWAKREASEGYVWQQDDANNGYVFAGTPAQAKADSVVSDSDTPAARSLLRSPAEQVRFDEQQTAG